jgi:hypothetical protein
MDLTGAEGSASFPGLENEILLSSEGSVPF